MLLFRLQVNNLLIISSKYLITTWPLKCSDCSVTAIEHNDITRVRYIIKIANEK